MAFQELQQYLGGYRALIQILIDCLILLELQGQLRFLQVSMQKVSSSFIAIVGSNNATLTLVIQADDVPEVEEIFQVELLSVNEVDQRISSTEVTSLCEQ